MTIIDQLFKDKTKEEVLLEVMRAALEAGDAIMEVYQSDFAVEQKDDRSPLTLADKRSHEVIVRHLAGLPLPLLSEEGRDIPYEERRNWRTFWLVDPLDGTKEFIKRNGEFTVNIALIHEGRPVLGVIYVPVQGVMYFAVEGLGSYKSEGSKAVLGVKSYAAKEGSNKAGVMDILIENAAKLPLPKDPGRLYTVIASRSHVSGETAGYLDSLREKHGELDIIPAGSSLKFCLVAEGRADCYPRLGPTMEWDTAAGQAIVEQAGGQVLDMETKTPLGYNKLVLLNPFFLVVQ